MCAPLRELADPLANRRIFDDARVSDHHAIIPTARRAALESLTAAERAVYDLVTRRFAAAFYPPYRYLKLEIVTRVGEHEFISRGSTPVDLGWKQLYRGVDDDEREPALPNATPGEQRPTLDALPLAKKTQPPKPYTDATLLQAMEGAGRALDDEELREAMRDSGLGTPATRAATIERLLEVGYCERTGKMCIRDSRYGVHRLSRRHRFNWRRQQRGQRPIRNQRGLCAVRHELQQRANRHGLDRNGGNQYDIV